MSGLSYFTLPDLNKFSVSEICKCLKKWRRGVELKIWYFLGCNPKTGLHAKFRSLLSSAFLASSENSGLSGVIGSSRQSMFLSCQVITDSFFLYTIVLLIPDFCRACRTLRFVLHRIPSIYTDLTRFLGIYVTSHCLLQQLECLKLNPA